LSYARSCPLPIACALSLRLAIQCLKPLALRAQPPRLDLYSCLSIPCGFTQVQRDGSAWTPYAPFSHRGLHTERSAATALAFRLWDVKVEPAPK